MQDDWKIACKKRLVRSKGQVRGIVHMLEEDHYCIDVVTQTAAAHAALRRVEEEILKDPIAHCVEHAISSGDADSQRRNVAELIDVMTRRRC